MHTYKNVIVEKEMNGLLKIVENPVPVMFEETQIGTAELRQNQHGLFADLKISSYEEPYGLYPSVKYQSEPATGNILEVILSKTINEDPAINPLKFSEEELSESNNDESEDRYHR